MTEQVDSLIHTVSQWYESKRNAGGSIHTNVMTVGLIVSGMIKDGIPILNDRISSPGASQVRGLSGAAIAAKLRSYGETRAFTSEGGRTSRGSLPLARELAKLLNDELAGVHYDEVRTGVYSAALERFFVEKLRDDFFDKQRISVDLVTNRPIPSLVAEILSASALRSDNTSGVVLQHLVGAKLTLRFPSVQIGQDRATTADLQSGRSGDFQIHDAAFHVTVSPMPRVIDRCKENIAGGQRPILIVPRGKVAAAEQLAEIEDIRDRIAILDAESFVGNNIEEISVYDSEAIKSGLARLIREYNRRIQTIEIDQSLQIEIPEWMTRS